VVGFLGMQVSSRGAYLDFDPCKPHGGTVICGWGIIIPVNLFPFLQGFFQGSSMKTAIEKLGTEGVTPLSPRPRSLFYGAERREKEKKKNPVLDSDGNVWLCHNVMPWKWVETRPPFPPSPAMPSLILFLLCALAARRKI